MKSNNGYSLIEVLIALLILSVGLLGIAGMQLTALKETELAALRSVAIVQAASLLQRLEANQTATARSRELKEWNQQNQRLLPEGRGAYNCVGIICCVTISWHWQENHQQKLGECDEKRLYVN